MHHALNKLGQSDAQTEKLGRRTTHSVKPTTHRYDGLFNLKLNPTSYPGV